MKPWQRDFKEKIVFFAIESVLIFMMPDAMAASDVDVTDISDNESEKTSDSDFSNTETGQIIYLSLSFIYSHSTLKVKQKVHFFFLLYEGIFP